MRAARLALAVLAFAGAAQAAGAPASPPDDRNRCLFHPDSASDRPDCAAFVDHRPATATRQAGTVPRQPHTTQHDAHN